MKAGLKYGAPQWLVEALGLSWRPGSIHSLFGVSGFDHVRTYKGQVVISQPYEADEQLGVSLKLLADAGMRVRLWGVSPYFPGHTFSLVIWRPQDEDIAREIMETMHAPFASESPAKTHEDWA